MVALKVLTQTPIPKAVLVGQGQLAMQPALAVLAEIMVHHMAGAVSAQGVAQQAILVMVAMVGI
jgi:hypothetical protein